MQPGAVTSIASGTHIHKILCTGPSSYPSATIKYVLCVNFIYSILGVHTWTVYFVQLIGYQILKYEFKVKKIYHL